MNYLFRPVDIAPLVVFRIVFGILGFADVTGVWIYYHLYKDYFNPDNFQFKYIGFEWAVTFPEPFMSLFFIVLMIAALFIVLGRWYRFFTVLFAAGFTYLFLLEKALYLNHGYLFCWISWIMIFLPANRQWSGDVLKDPSLTSDVIQRWSLWILPFLMGVVYFYGGIAKVNLDWMDGNPLKIWLQNVADMPLLGKLWGWEPTAYVMAWSGMLLDLSAPFLLLFRRTRKWILAFILFFHLTNTLIFQIGIFPWLSIMLSLLYFPPPTFRQWYAILKKKIPKLSGIETWWDNLSSQAESPVIPERIPPGYPRNPVTVCLVLLVTFHLLVPLRHHYFEGPVAWTEEGHRYSWRMMLRSKRGYGYFRVVNPETGETVNVYPRNLLTGRQLNKLNTHPDMIWQFAQLIEKQWKEKGVNNPEVYAEVKVRLNGRKAQTYIDPEVNLAAENWYHCKTSHWVMPFQESEPE